MRHKDILNTKNQVLVSFQPPKHLSLKFSACRYDFECDFFIAKDSDGVTVTPEISLKVFNKHIRNFFRIGSLVVPDNPYQRSILSFIPGLSGSKRTGS